MPVTIYQNYQVIGVYSISVNYLTLSSNDPGALTESNGTVTTNTSAGTLSYGTGQTITINEYTSSGGTFSGWYLDGAYMGTSSSLTVTMNADHQLAAFFAGTSTSPTPAPSSMPAPTTNPNLVIPVLQFYCTSLTTNSQYNIQIAGSLACNSSNSGLVDAGVYLSYSVTNGNTWQDFAYVQTDSYGNFAADWMPSASGNYIIRAVYFGDNYYSAVTQTSNFALSPLENQNQVFSVDSNSTVTGLAFDSTTDALSFGVSGPSGTTGYAQICISKTLLPDITKLQITLDSSMISYASYSDGNTWLVTIYYHHSSHTIVMALNSPTAIVSASPSPNANPTATTTSGSNTSNPTAIPAVTTTPSVTPTSTPEFPLVLLPIVLVIGVLSIAVALNKKAKPKA